jgi:hypothetical protein
MDTLIPVVHVIVARSQRSCVKYLKNVMRCISAALWICAFLQLNTGYIVTDYQGLACVRLQDVKSSFLSIGFLFTGGFSRNHF